MTDITSMIDDLVQVISSPVVPQEDFSRTVSPLVSEVIQPQSTVPLVQIGQNLAPVVTYDAPEEEMTEEEIYHRRIGVIEADIESNCIEHGIRGILKHADIQAMIAEYSEDDKQARIYGKFQHLTGLVYKEFSRSIHVIRPFRVRPVDYCVIQLLDPHPRNPDAVMWVAIDKNGRKFIVDELYETVTSTDELAARIKSRDTQYRVVQRRADPLAWNTNQHDPSRKTLAKELAENQLIYIPASKDRSMGIQLTHNALSYETVKIGDSYELVKAPMLYVFDTCVRTIWEFEHWQYNEWTGKAAEKRNQSEKPQDKDDHMMENTGRALLDEIAFVPQPIEAKIATGGKIPTLDPFS